MRRILIIGAGQSGLQLGLSLLAEGYDVTIMSARTPDEIRAGWVTSTQMMFGPALNTERAYGLNLWEQQTPHVEGLHVNLSAPPGERAMNFFAPVEEYAMSVDQRLKMSTWLELFEERGGTIHYQGVTTADLDGLTKLGRYDLTIVAAGKGELVSAFDRDPSRSPFTTPQRALAVTYIHGMTPEPLAPMQHVSFSAVPGIAELFVMPVLTLSGPADLLFWEAIPGGPADLWQERRDPTEQLKLTLDLCRQYTPWIYERCRNVELTDARGALSGRYTPTVRRPVADLPGGGLALGMADVVVANDPITGQGSNTAAKCAASYLRSILDRGDQPFDRAWMEQTFETFWTGHGHAVTDFTNALLQPMPEHVQAILGTAAGNEAVARRFGHGFADPNSLRDWFFEPDKAMAYIASVSQ